MSKDININWDNTELNPITTDVLLNHVETLKTNQISDIDKLSESCLVDFTKRLTAPPVAMEINRNDKPITLFTKGNFSIVTGKAKSRKSFLISMLMATAIKGEFQNHFFCKSKGTNILFDTEQAEYKVLQVSKRICQLAEVEKPDNFISITFVFTRLRIFI